MTGGTRSEELRLLAQRIVDDLPADVVEEAVLTGSVSRGMADEVSDIEMLLVTPEVLELDRCYALARGAGLADLDTWGPRDPLVRRVFGYREGVPIELVWWPRELADTAIEKILAGEMASSADAFVNGVALRTSGLLAAWQERLRHYPPELATARIETAALLWGGYAPAGLLTLLRADDRLTLTEWLVDAATRVLTILFAVNGVWQPTSKRLAIRVAPLAIKPDRLAERIEEALTERDPRRALLLMTEVQLDAVLLAPSGPYVDRARVWLSQGVELLRE